MNNFVTKIKDNYKVILRYIALYFVFFVLLMCFATNQSPIFKDKNVNTQCDTSVFRYIGLQFITGKKELYTEIYDIKGLYLFTFYGVLQLVGGDYLILLVLSLLYTLTVYYGFKFINLFQNIKPSLKKFLIIFILAITFLIVFAEPGRNEDILLCFEMICCYILTKLMIQSKIYCLDNNVGDNVQTNETSVKINKQVLNIYLYNSLLLVGFLIGIILFFKFALIIPILVFGLCYFIFLIKNKDFKTLWLGLLTTFGGVIIGVLPVFIYGFTKGSDYLILLLKVNFIDTLLYGTSTNFNAQATVNYVLGSLLLISSVILIVFREKFYDKTKFVNSILGLVFSGVILFLSVYPAYILIITTTIIFACYNLFDNIKIGTKFCSFKTDKVFSTLSFIVPFLTLITPIFNVSIYVPYANKLNDFESFVERNCEKDYVLNGKDFLIFDTDGRLYNATPFDSRINNGCKYFANQSQQGIMINPNYYYNLYNNVFSSENRPRYLLITDFYYNQGIKVFIDDFFETNNFSFEEISENKANKIEGVYYNYIDSIEMSALFEDYNVYLFERK